MNKEMITISKDKLVLLSQLLKEVKNQCSEIQGKELTTYAYKSQRAIVETILNDAVDKTIDTLKRFQAKEQLKALAKEDIRGKKDEI